MLLYRSLACAGECMILLIPPFSPHLTPLASPSRVFRATKLESASVASAMLINKSSSPSLGSRDIVSDASMRSGAMLRSCLLCPPRPHLIRLVQLAPATLPHRDPLL